jgi:ABC-type transporter Mla subunit MlaD
VKSDTSYFIIGLFVAVGVILLTAGVVLFGTRGLGPDAVACYTLIEESVSGLETGAPVRFRGVQVGRVERMFIANQVFDTDLPYIAVEFSVVSVVDSDTLKERIREYVGQGFRLRLSSSGLSGVAYLEGDFMGDDASERYPPLERDWLEPGAEDERLYIPSAPSTLESLVDSLRKFLDDLRDTDVSGLVEDAKKTLNAITKAVEDLKLDTIEGNLNTLLVDADEVVKNLDGKAAAFMDEATAAARSVNEAVKKVEALIEDPRIGGTLTNVEELTAKANALLDDPSISKTLANIEAASAEAQAAIAAIKEAAEPIPGALNDVRRLIRGKGRDVDRILRNIDQLTAHLNNLAATIERYPSYLLFGNPPPRKEPEK